MRDYWQKSYNIDVNSPVIGVIEPKLVSKKVPSSEAVVSLKTTTWTCIGEPTLWRLIQAGTET